jgi:hypothetical protein
MSDKIRELRNALQGKPAPAYVPKKYVTDIDIPGIDAKSDQETMRQLNEKLLRELRDQHRARNREPLPSNRGLLKPQTPDDWKRSYRKGYAT